MAPISLKKTVQQYKSLSTNLESKIQQLYSKRTELENRGFVVIDENPRFASSSPAAASSSSSTAAAAEFMLESPSLIAQKIAARGNSGGGVNEARKQSRSKSPSSPPDIASVLEESVELDRIAAANDTQEDLVHVPARAAGPGELAKSLNPALVRERMPSLIEESVLAHSSDVTSLVSAATNILIESMQLRLSYVQEVLNKLTLIQQENPKFPTPPELLFSRYEEWVQRNQRLIELNSQLYDLEKLKFELKEKRSKVKASGAPKGQQHPGEIEQTLTGSQFVHSSVQRIQAFFSQLQFNTTTSDRTRAFLMELLDPKGERMTLESQKINEYVGQCLQPSTPGAELNETASPERYKEFMAILCGYIVEKQREVQGEELPFDLVFSTVERYLIPKILPAILRHVAQPERDLKIQNQCEKFQDVTLEQLRVKPSLQSKELVPFINSVTQLRASYFTPTPTGKMYAVVAAAKALYEQLGEMGESSIDGDSFLDLWIYVIIKAGVKDLATNLRFMEGYGNPRLSMDEAGYYLTTLEAAATFIERLKPESLKQPPMSEFVVCECSWFKELSAKPGSCIQVVSERQQLQGFKVAVVKEWALNRTRLFRAVLLQTEDMNDIAVVSVIRLSSEQLSNAAHVEYLTRQFTEPQNDMEGLKSFRTPLGLAITADTSAMDPRRLITLPTGDYDAHSSHLDYIIQLIRLGCEFRDDNCDMVDLPSSVPDQKNGEFVYVFTPPEENSKFLMQDISTPGANKALDQSTASSRSTNRQFPQGPPGAQRSGESASNHNSLTNRLIRSFRRSKSKSPQPAEDSLSSVPPNLRPTSPYLLSYNTNRGSSSMEVSLDTFPSQTPQQQGDDDEIDFPQTSATKRLLGLFHWRRRKQGSYTVPAGKSSTLPPAVHSQQQQQEERERQGKGWVDEHRDQFQTFSQSQSIQRHNQSLSRDYGSTSYNEQHAYRSYRPSTFSGADSFAVSSSGTVLGAGGGGGGPNVVTVEVEVHNVDESLELNSESPAHKPHPPPAPGPVLPTNSYSINNKSTESTDGDFLTLPAGALAPASSKKSSIHGRRRIFSFGTAKDQKKKKQKHHRPKSRTVVDDRIHHLQVPLLEDHHRETEEVAAGSCSDSDEAGDSEDGSYNNYSNNESRSSASSVKTLESSFTAEDRSARPSTLDTVTSLEIVMVDCMSEEFVSRLEQNFKKDHLLREACTDLKEAVSDTIKQGQLYLQRLNYLSTMHKLDGVFTNATRAAVTKFQLAHNAYESKYSVLLPENGYLTAATLQYLRQAFFTVYASLLRLGYEPQCGESFNPTSTSQENVKAFFNCVLKFQKDSELPLIHQDGVLCEATLKKIRQTVRTSRRTL